MRRISAILFLSLIGGPVLSQDASSPWVMAAGASDPSRTPFSVLKPGNAPLPPLSRRDGYRSDREPLQTHSVIARYDDSTRLGSGTGAYQLGFFALEKLGYIAPNQKHPGFGPSEWRQVMWTGKDGIRNRNQFMLSHQVQDVIFGDLISMKRGK